MTYVEFTTGGHFYCCAWFCTVLAFVGVIGLLMMLLLNDLSPTTSEMVEGGATDAFDGLTGDPNAGADTGGTDGTEAPAEGEGEAPPDDTAPEETAAALF